MGRNTYFTETSPLFTDQRQHCLLLRAAFHGQAIAAQRLHQIDVKL